MKTTLIVFAVLLLVLTLIGTFGGSVRYTEPFYQEPTVPDQMVAPPPVSQAPPAPPAGTPPSQPPSLPPTAPPEGAPQEKKEPSTADGFYQGASIEPFDQYDSFSNYASDV